MSLTKKQKLNQKLSQMSPQEIEARALRIQEAQAQEQAGREARLIRKKAHEEAMDRAQQAQYEKSLRRAERRVVEVIELEEKLKSGNYLIPKKPYKKDAGYYGIIFPAQLEMVSKEKLNKAFGHIQTYEAGEGVVAEGLTVQALQGLKFNVHSMPTGSYGDVVEKWDILVELKDGLAPIQVKSSREAAEKFSKEFPSCIVVWFVQHSETKSKLEDFQKAFTELYSQYMGIAPQIVVPLSKAERRAQHEETVLANQKAKLERIAHQEALSQAKKERIAKANQPKNK